MCSLRCRSVLLGFFFGGGGIPVVVLQAWVHHLQTSHVIQCLPQPFSFFFCEWSRYFIGFTYESGTSEWPSEMADLVQKFLFPTANLLQEAFSDTNHNLCRSEILPPQRHWGVKWATGSLVAQLASCQVSLQGTRIQADPPALLPSPKGAGAACELGTLKGCWCWDSQFTGCSRPAIAQCWGPSPAPSPSPTLPRW